MKEGAWVNGHTGEWAWVREHASWVQLPANAVGLGMAEDAAQRLAAMPWDFNGPGRRAILLTAMTEGFIRVRGHGAYVSVEHALPQAQVIASAWEFMSANFGPQMLCRFTALHQRAVLEVVYADLVHSIETATDDPLYLAAASWDKGGTREPLERKQPPQGWP